MNQDKEMDQLNLVESVVISDKLTLNVYTQNGQKFIGLNHFQMETEMLLKEESMNKIIDYLQLTKQEASLKSQLSKFKKEEN